MFHRRVEMEKQDHRKKETKNAELFVSNAVNSCNFLTAQMNGVFVAFTI
jgi:hypothetical protein